MDISKFKIPTLDGPNWGLWFTHIQLTTRILNIWDVMRGEVLNTVPPTRDLLAKLSPPVATATAAEIAAYSAAKATSRQQYPTSYSKNTNYWVLPKRYWMP